MSEIISLVTNKSPPPDTQEFYADIIDLIKSEKHGNLTISQTLGVLEMVKFTMLKGMDQL
jgi:hypothetical protein